jgi:hypothetical protein
MIYIYVCVFLTVSYKFPDFVLPHASAARKINQHKLEPVPKLIDYALTRMVLGQTLAVFQAFSLAKL